ncbi:hypothetical protein ACL2XO_23555 [Sodalis sp. RH15]|uniref:hypothetical protein n=1 Tax=Sodalis sp. RH15 TaxID=3394330 RepID=UPI0039B4A78D
MANYVVLGSWKIRHDEQVSPAERSLYFVALPEGETITDKSILCDLRGLTSPVLDAPAGHPVIDASLNNLSSESIPLAVVSTTPTGWQLTHLVHRIEVWVTHFLALENLPISITEEELFDALCTQFHQNYLYNNNFECYYEKGIPDTELEQKFNIKQNYNFYELNERFYAALADGKVANFRPHLGDEIEHWSYDNDLFEIAPNEKHIAGYVSVMHWSRKKKIRFDEPVVTFKKKLYQEDALERWERNYHFQRIDTTPEEALSRFFELPLKELPSWRRVRLDIACEYLPTGDIYMLNFEDCRIKDVHDAAGRLQQCEIEYLKTRGKADKTNIYRGFNALVIEVESFIQAQELSFEKSHYSKLTFLKDFQASSSYREKA